MIDSKKLAATPLTEFEIGSNEFCMAVMAHNDAGRSFAAMCLELNLTLQKVSYSATKGRRIRDRLIAEGAKAALEAIQAGDVPPPRINKEVPEVKVVAVSFMCPPRGLEPARLHEPMKITHAVPMTLQ